MLTVIFTEKTIHVFGHNGATTPVALVNAELAGRRYPMTSTFHVFLNTIINRYKERFAKVQYPIPINIAFPTSQYFSTAARTDLLNYIKDRSEVLLIRERKSLMEAVVEGWKSRKSGLTPAWIAIEGTNEMIIGVKEGIQWPLKIKNDPEIGTDALLPKLQEYASERMPPQDAVLIKALSTLEMKHVDQLFISKKIVLEFPENQDLPDGDVEFSESLRDQILKNISNNIFLHINNLYVKLPNGNPVLFIGSFFNQTVLRKIISADGLRYDYPTTFIKEEQIPLIAAASFNKTTEQQTHLSQTAKNTSTIDNEVNLASSPQSQTLTQSENSKIPVASKETMRSALISREFVIEKRFKDQSFLFFRGYKKSEGIRRFYRYTAYEDCNSVDRRADFIKLYKKEQKLYPEISAVVNGKSGKYYYLPDCKAKPFREIAASITKKGSSKSFKSEDLQLLRDIYKAIDLLPLTFSNLSADNIYVDQGKWWRQTKKNNIYFLGISPEDSTKNEMTKRLNEVLQSIIHPTIIDHIHN